MSLLHGRHACALALATSLAACSDSRSSVGPRATNSPDQSATSQSDLAASTVPTVSKLLGRATFSDPDGENFKVMRVADDWHFDLKAKPAVDVAVQTIAFAPNAQSTWHLHPGPVFIQVTTGTISFYMANDPTCTAVIRTAGQSYVDMGEHTHMARNEGAVAAQTLVTYFLPPGAPLKIDQPRPGNCPF
ncbi:MAG TPA: hypothetical protein VGG84_14785 [Gemmatimonadaceae bacterium]|jgi:hypothetical protein